MIICPIIELQGGRCVSLHRGRLDEPEIWHVDPLAKAAEFAETGATLMQVTDFDAITGDDSNRELIERIIRETPISVQVAGGIRTRERAAEWLDLGAARVVIGTAAVLNPSIVTETAKFHPDAVVLAVDVYQGHVMSQGWRETSAFEPEAFISHFEDSPLAALSLTDIDADVGDTDATLSLVHRVAASTRHPVLASGMVRGLDDISRLKYAGKVAGAMVGRALFRRQIDLAEALAVASAPTARTADFI
ncbi:1-(5-phosphoribosyl)-5-[(5-phosphoribosylamino)methylideneamino] imidazole-4-carboxamide isomerase [Rhodobacteraceae bacterium 2376]|uniref:1-(5-phosphoribosyl)-5-[(5-phosphoribosylamino)methylideneamino] imidazole-4-carboxamide isomerase n=1 Tax=Rhabdonatronobacter sediminivivens TaxID=2743469 RepID=A0A7Z0KYH1_9RHOB|nr:1-(5-phosphoribosyl)-5-[(5-phosphoribosylamino)methylideneamino] imidazole-4-carboxamide isomerase [Rhabdonatronobacter sediminivivens]NYS23378.1 1-(5-phosphoribosyl)-5-[(5-phosphoribosylamino)methylideneamino] imidazole-4-carboxamide isomerase [Rhabdonatronobacter sediminivivens]